MVEVGQSLISFMLAQPVSVMECFQRVNSLIPEDQDVTCCRPRNNRDASDRPDATTQLLATARERG